MELHSVRLEIPEGGNVILGQTHFIKTVEDVYEAIVTTVGQPADAATPRAAPRTLVE